MNSVVTERAPQSAAAAADLLILGVGSASPRAVAALARAIDMPIEAVVDAVYRAPARLLANLATPDACRLVEIVQALGLRAAAVAPAEVPARAPVLDVAGDLTDWHQADAVATALAGFLGVTPTAALDALLTPPGILLGNVTAATLDALRAALPAGAVALSSAEPRSSRYALFASSLTPLQQNLLRKDLPDDVQFGASGSVTLFDLTREHADAIWRRLKALDSVRIVNQAFLRFTVLLTSAPEGGAHALQALAGVPVADYPLLASVLPVPVELRVDCADVAARLAAYVAGGFDVRAELSTFAMVQFDVLAAPVAMLETLGVTARPPFRTAPMPEPRARLFRARLEAAGGDVVEVA